MIGKVSGLEIATKKAHEREIVGRSRRLLARLSVRPHERQSLVEYSDLAYDMKQYEAALKHVQHIIHLDVETTGAAPARLYIRKARAAFRAWQESADVGFLRTAREAYRTAIHDHHVSRQRHAYYELATIHYRLGEYQEALDTFGAAMVIFQKREEEEERDWMYVAQYSMAHIMFLSGNVESAQAIYTELMLTPIQLHVKSDGDSIVLLPLRFTNIGITLEKALIMKRTGQRELGLQLLRETWNRMDKFHKVLLLSLHI
jgi:tetratricopeptide (TPR) repeat protein